MSKINSWEVGGLVDAAKDVGKIKDPTLQAAARKLVMLAMDNTAKKGK